jgi:hypothetical protein
MEIVIEVSGGQDDELARIQDDLHERGGIAGGRVVRSPATIREGTLGVEQILIFAGQNVALPLLVQALYDYLKSRRRTRSAANLKMTLARTDLPDGARRVELTLEGAAEDVIEAACKELGE